MTPEQMRQHAEELIRDHATDIEFLSIGESLEDVLVDADEGEYERLAGQIDELIKRAEITVTWPAGGGSDG